MTKLVEVSSMTQEELYLQCAIKEYENSIFCLQTSKNEVERNNLMTNVDLTGQKQEIIRRGIETMTHLLKVQLSRENIELLNDKLSEFISALEVPTFETTFDPIV